MRWRRLRFEPRPHVVRFARKAGQQCWRSLEFEPRPHVVGFDAANEVRICAFESVHELLEGTKEGATHLQLGLGLGLGLAIGLG